MLDIDAGAVRALLVSAGMRRTVSEGNIGRIVKEVRKGLGLSQADLGRAAGYSQASISRLENGSTRIGHDLDAVANLATVLKIPFQVLGLESGATKAGDDVQRRTFITRAASVSAMALLPSSMVSATKIGSADVRDGWVALRRLMELDQSIGGGNCYRIAADMASQLQKALGEASFTGSARSELQALVAASMGRAGWFAFDAEEPAIARNWWLESYHLAHVAGAQEQQVATLAVMSLQSLRDPARSKETLNLTEATRKYGEPFGNPTLYSILAARDAVAHAQSGDKSSARAAISTARGWLDKGRDGTEPAVWDFWGPADLACHEMRVALSVGDGKAAERSARTALGHADRTGFARNHLSYAVDLGTVLARVGQIDESISITSEAIEKLDDIRDSRRVRRDIRLTLQVLSAYDYRPAREFASAASRILGA